MKIVIVEDDALISFQIESCVKRLGHYVLGCFTEAKEALDFIANEKPDFVFMDIELEGAMDGIQCANILKSKYGVPSLFVTSHDETDVIEETMSFDPLNFLPKPFTDKNIEASIALASIKLKQNKEVPKTSITTLGNYTFHFDYNTLKYNNEIVKLTPKELKLVILLFKNVGNTVSIEEIQNYIWDGKSISSAAFRKLISRTNDNLPEINIISNKGVGYFLKEQ